MPLWQGGDSVDNINIVTCKTKLVKTYNFFQCNLANQKHEIEIAYNVNMRSQIFWLGQLSLGIHLTMVNTVEPLSTEVNGLCREVTVLTPMKHWLVKFWLAGESMFALLKHHGKCWKILCRHFCYIEITKIWNKNILSAHHQSSKLWYAYLYSNFFDLMHM